MGRFVGGDIVVAPFPFSNLTGNKRRPALVVTPLSGRDVILCQITSQAVSDDYAIPMEASDLASGRLKKKSNVRPNRLFTADSDVVLYKAGVLKPGKMREVVGKIVQIIEGSVED